ncbi:MAG: hypothetical protein ACKVS8_04625 [Phycisphaerales bacterium]
MKLHSIVLTVAGLSSLACAIALAGGAPPAGRTDSATPVARAGADKPVDVAGLHNVVAFYDGVFSGSVPEGDAGFETLKAWGVRTILSVDGAAPDVERARVRGMRYVHLPIGYDGFDEARRAELARAVRDLPKPMYIHCHHGKHRSAGAAASALASLGWIAPERGVERMKVSGTSSAYTGLYQCAAGATVMTAAEVDAAAADFPEVTRPEGLVAAMVAIDEAMERLKLIEKAGWRVPRDHPDLVPAAEAGRLADALRVSGEHGAPGRALAAQRQEFAAQVAAGVIAATALEETLARAGAVDVARASGAMRLVAANCKDCHAVFRDKPAR